MVLFDENLIEYLVKYFFTARSTMLTFGIFIISFSLASVRPYFNFYWASFYKYIFINIGQAIYWLELLVYILW
jgi:hypothetical protein